jgi:hypothetical protein
MMLWTVLVRNAVMEMPVLTVTKVESPGTRRSMSYARTTGEQTKNVEMLKGRSVPSGMCLNGGKGDWG